MKDIVFSSTTQLAAAIRAGHVSATEVLEAHLAQIATHNPALNAIIPHLRGFRLLSYHREAKRLILTCERVTRTALCPVCGTAAHRIHSRYQRTVWDLSMQNVQVILHLHVRKFSCDQPSCQPGPGRTCHQVIVCWGWLMPAERIL